MHFRKSGWVGVVLAAGALAGVIWLMASPMPWRVIAGDPDLHRLSSKIHFFSWWAGVANVILLLGLASTTKWWVGEERSDCRAWFPVIPTPRWFWASVATALVLCAGFGAQRIGQSLWDDEDTSVRLYIHGELFRQQDGSLKWKHPGWDDAFFNYHKPSNHQLQTILSRSAHDTWKALFRPGGLQLNEAVMRIPVILAGLGSILAVALLMRRIGCGTAGAVAAFLLALHPWHIRYATEIRGYIFTVFLVPLTLWLLLEAIERQRFRWWMLFAVSNFAALYSHPGTLYNLVVINACGMVAVILRNRSCTHPWQQPARFVAANVFSGMLYLQMMLPCLPQLSQYLKSERSLGEMTPRWNANLMSHFFAGIPWNNSDTPSAGFPELKWVAEGMPLLYFGMLWVCLGLIVIGLLRLAWTRPAGWMVSLAFLIPPLAVYAGARANGNYLYEWYLTPALPGVVCAASTGIVSCGEALRRFSKFLPWGLIIVFVGLYTWTTQFARHWLLAHSLQPMRESVLFVRPTLDPYDPRQAKVLTARLNAPPRSYDPNSLSIAKMEDFMAAIRLADESGKPLYVNYGNLHAAAVDYPEIYAVIEDDRFFDKIAELPGFDPSLARYIRLYKPGSLVGEIPPGH